MSGHPDDAERVREDAELRAEQHEQELERERYAPAPVAPTLRRPRWKGTPTFAAACVERAIAALGLLEAVNVELVPASLARQRAKLARKQGRPIALTASIQDTPRRGGADGR